MCYSKIFKNDGEVEKHVPVIPVLPNLITTTNEVTLFATPSKIFDKEKTYLVARPTVVKNEKMDSGKCNDYSTNDIGDSHCRGLRIVLNTTFTAGGLAAPIFVIIYGLTADEMPCNEIVTVPIPGLTVGADRNVYCDKEGYVTFVRGNYECKDGEEQEQEDVELEGDLDDDNQTYSKESQVARLYRTLVYHPFIRTIRMTQYGWSGEGEVLDDLTTVGWMDGAHGQLKLITDEENLEKEKKLKITSGKHSAARTGREQSADLSPNFKLMKKTSKLWTFRMNVLIL